MLRRNLASTTPMPLLNGSSNRCDLETSTLGPNDHDQSRPPAYVIIKKDHLKVGMDVDLAQDLLHGLAGFLHSSGYHGGNEVARLPARLFVALHIV